MKMPKVEKLMRDIPPHLHKVAGPEYAALITPEVNDKIRAVLKKIMWNDRKTYGMNYGINKVTNTVDTFSIENHQWIFEYTLDGEFVGRNHISEFYGDAPGKKLIMKKL